MMRLYCPVFLSSRPHFTSANWLVVLQCSVTCGIGSRRRAVICSGGRNKCDPKGRPEDISQCNPGACPEWKAGEWSKVGVFQIFWFFFLSHSRHFYSWSKKALIVFMIIYSKCSVTCGSGSKQRRVECSRSDITCDPARKPTSATRCELGACPKWETGEWSLVSVFQTTLNYHWAAVVILGSYVIVPRLGLTVVQPHRNRTLVLLPNATAIWMLVTGRNHVPSFQCSVTCGDGRKQRPVSCSAGTNKCDPKTKPQSSVSCNAGSCPYWKVTKWSQVSKSEHILNQTVINVRITT